jgi:hypothetical protein
MIARSMKAKLLVFTVFFVGIATGALVGNFYATRVTSSANTVDRAQRAQRDINNFYDYLELDQPQREQMRKIGDETRREFEALRVETQPRYEKITENSRAKIRAVLNDDQRRKYDEFRRNMDERRKNRNRDNKDGGGPGPDRNQKP